MSAASIDDAWRALCEKPDDAAFTLIFDASKAEVWSLCLRILRNTSDAEDACQSVYLRLWLIAREKSKTTPFDGIKRLIYRVAIWEAQNLRKRRLRRQAREVAMEKLPEIIDRNPGPDQVAANQQLSAQIELLIALLPEKYSLPLVLHYFHGLPQTEIAAVLGVSQTIVSRRITKGLKRLDPLARRARLDETMRALVAVGGVRLLMEPPAALAAELILTKIQAAMAAGTAASVTLGTAGLALNKSVWGAFLMKTKSMLLTPAMLIAIGAILIVATAYYAMTPSASSAHVRPQVKNADSSLPLSEISRVIAQIEAEHEKSKNLRIEATFSTEANRIGLLGIKWHKAKNKTNVVEHISGDKYSSTVRIFQDVERKYRYLFADNKFYSYYVDEPADVIPNAGIALDKKFALLKKLLRMWENSPDAIGTFFSSDVRPYYQILRENIDHLRMSREKLDAHDCYLIQGPTDHGYYEVWIDPNNGYLVRRAKVIKKPRDKHWISSKDGLPPVKSVSHSEFLLDRVVIEKKDGKPYIKNAERHRTERSSKSALKKRELEQDDGSIGIPAHYDHECREQITVDDIEWNPDFEKLDVFKPDFIPNGTMTYLIDEALYTNSNAGRPSQRYIWLDGEVVRVNSRNSASW